MNCACNMHALSLVSTATVVCCISVLFAAFTAHYSYSFELLLTFICCLYTIITGMHIIGASVSEPHTSESNWDFSYIIYYIFSGVCRSVYSQRCNLTR